MVAIGDATVCGRTDTFAELDAQTHQFSDNEVARRLNQARAELFRTINKAQTPAA